MQSINAVNITKYYGIDCILDNVSFSLNYGEKAGIVGDNGAGKTTLINIIAGKIPYDGGAVNIRKNAVIGYLEQIPEYSGNVHELIMSGFSGLLSIEKQMRLCEHKMCSPDIGSYDTLLDKYGELQEQFEKQGGYSIEERFKKVVTGMNVPEDMLSRSFETLSGGEKTRIILCKLLVEEPDILLLDEPTNHLDIDAVEWLEGYLRSYEGCVCIISHDRYFLDHIVDKVIEVEDCKLKVYHGNFSYYFEEKQKYLALQYQLYCNQQKKVKSMEEAIKRFRLWGKKSDDPRFFKKARNMEKRLENMDKIDRPRMEKDAINLAFSAGGKSGRDVVRTKGLCKAFGENILFEDMDLHVGRGEKVFLLGKNGTGKTTLFRMILGEEEADAGTIRVPESGRFGYIPQEIIFEKPKRRVIDEFQYEFPYEEGRCRHKLARFNFYGEDVFKQVGDLSGGEKVRLKLCMLMETKVNVLLMDEPTNHLDITSREVLEETLADYEGTLICISHDRYFIDKLADRILRIKDHDIESWYGDYTYFREKTKEIEEHIEAPENITCDNRETEDAASLEKKIAKLEERLARLKQEMAYEDSVSILKADASVIEKQLKALYEKWERVCEKP